MEILRIPTGGIPIVDSVKRAWQERQERKRTSQQQIYRDFYDVGIANIEARRIRQIVDALENTPEDSSENTFALSLEEARETIAFAVRLGTTPVEFTGTVIAKLVDAKGRASVDTITNKIASQTNVRAVAPFLPSGTIDLEILAEQIRKTGGLKQFFTLDSDQITLRFGKRIIKQVLTERERIKSEEKKQPDVRHF